MSKSSFEEQIMQGAYALGRQCDQLASERRELARRLRYTQHAARLKRLSKQYDFGMVFLSAMGAVPLILLDAKGTSGAWAIVLLSMLLMLSASGFAWGGRKMAARTRRFHNRFAVWKQ